MALVGPLVAAAAISIEGDVSELYFPTTGSEPITIVNDSSSEVIVSVDFAQDDVGFSVDPAGPYTIAANGGQQAVEISWTDPGDSQPVTDTVTFTPDDGSGAITVDLAAGPAFTLSTDSVDLGSVNVNQPTLDDEGMNSIGLVVLTHSGETFPDLTLDFPTTFPDSSTGPFVARIQGGQSHIVGNGGTRSFRIGFHPTEEGPVSAPFEIGSADWTETVTVSGDGVTGPVLYRVNTGGLKVDVDPGATQSFTEDRQINTSPFFTSTLDNRTIATGAPDGTDPSVPAVTPEAIFESERFDENDDGTDLTYSFPTASPGTAHIVRLFFAETFTGVTGPGDRLFDVVLEGSVAIEDLDLFAEAGRDAFAKAFLIEADSAIGVELARGAMENPKINGIEIVEGGSAVLSAANTDFGEPFVGTASTETVTVTNGADVQGPAVRIDGATFTGPGASDYQVTSPLPVWVEPGDSVDLEVTLEASATGDRSATMSIDVWGDDAAASAELSAEAQVSPATLGVSPSSLSLGSVAVGSSGDGTLTLTNQHSSAPITIQDVEITGSSAFSVVGNVPGSLAAGASAELTVRFTPTAEGGASATLQVNHSGENSPQSVSLSGTGVAVLDDGIDFIDDDDSIFEADIEWLAAVGITRGCNPPDNDRFCPDDFVTRGQMAAFFVRALGLTDDGGGDLFDDDDSSVFEGDIDRLGTAGITRGCNPPQNNLFCPDDNVTRGQMAAFFVRALNLSDAGEGDLFVDDDSSVFEGDIDRLATADITRGCNPPENDRFCPDDFVTRGQMAAFFHRAADLLGLPR